MINRLHRLLHDPARGWDPIPASYAERYSISAAADWTFIDWVEKWAGGFAGKRVADIGSGPGQYALEFARRGAHVTCVDVSRRYLEIARRTFLEAGREAEFILAYMDDVGELAPKQFDLIFSNVCWYYCLGDCSFAASLLRALKKGGGVAIRVQNAASDVNTRSLRRALYCVYKRFHWKVGHLFPPRGRVAYAFERQGTCTVTADYTDPNIDVVFVEPVVTVGR